MHPDLQSVLEELRQRRQRELVEALDDALEQLAALIRLDQHHRHGREPEKLAASMGPLGSSTLDLSSLSGMISRTAASRLLPDARLHRVQHLLKKLEDLREACQGEACQPATCDLQEGAEAILAKAEAHYAHSAELFLGLRQAQLEIRSKYEPEWHDAAFARFSWRQLSAAERALCPPLIVIGDLASGEGAELRTVLAVLEGRHPLKVLLQRSRMARASEPGGDFGAPPVLSVEMLPLAMRGIGFLQSTPAEEDFPARLMTLLSSSRPAVASLLLPQEDETAFPERARNAIRSRAFPLLAYDPDSATEFVACLDLSGNPAPEQIWDPGDPHASPPEPPYTFADFAAGDPEFQAAFQPPDPAAHPASRVPLAEYLDLNRRQRSGKVPVIQMRSAEGQTGQRVVPPEIVHQSLERRHLWRTLQELAGTDNPHVRDTRRELEAAFGAEQKALLESLQNEMEEQVAERETAAVAHAVRRMVAHLTGVPPETINLEAFLQKASPPKES